MHKQSHKSLECVLLIRGSFATLHLKSHNYFTWKGGCILLTSTSATQLIHYLSDDPYELLSAPTTDLFNTHNSAYYANFCSI